VNDTYWGVGTIIQGSVIPRESESDIKTGVVAVAVGNEDKNVCSKGIAYGATFIQQGGIDVS
jgi:hypothetical protein